MKAQTFLKLVEETLTAQQNYFTASRKFGRQSQEALVLLIKSKGLEKQCWVVIKEGRLEPDEPTVLDTVAVQRPNVAEQKTLFTEDGNEQNTEGH